MEPYKDIELNCVCGKKFIWTSGEQSFMNDLLEKGKIEEVKQPKRCKECRIKNREKRERDEDNAREQRGY